MGFFWSSGLEFDFASGGGIMVPRGVVRGFHHMRVLCTFGWSLDYIRSLNPKPQQHPTHSHIVAIVVPFAGYLMGSYMWNWLNQKQELQWIR